MELVLRSLLHGGKRTLLWLVFNSDGVGDEVIIRNAELYDLVEIKQRSRKQSFPIALAIPSLMI